MSPQPPGSYSGNPLTSPKDEVRFLTGDTGWNGVPWQLADAEIEYQLVIQYPPPALIPPTGNYLPAAYCADAIAARYKNLVDKSVGDLKISYSGLLKQFQEIAARLRSRAAIKMVPVYSGGIYASDKLSKELNTSLTKPAVVIDGMDNTLPTPQVPGAGNSGI